MRPRIKITPANVIEIKRLKAAAAGILDDVHQFIGRFVAYPSEHAHDAHALWCVHAHLMRLWDTTPRIAFLSPEPASGKSRALEVTELLVPNPILAVNVSPAYLFRKVGSEDGPPTILFDEIDTVFGPKAKDNHEETRGLLNAGHRSGAVTGRCVMQGKTVATEEIPAYSAVALAGLGWLPDTIMSRAVIVRMRRRHHGEHIEAFRRRIHVVDGHRIRDRIESWALTQTELEHWPQLPPGVDDRDADVWEPLVAVADMVGGDWPKLAREAAVALIAAAKELEPSLGIRLLMDLKTIFENEDALHTKTILARLIAIEEAPWGDLRGKPLDDRGLAKRLREYSIQPDTLRIEGAKLKGYRREALADAWGRYVPAPAIPEISVASVASVATQQNQWPFATAATDKPGNATDGPLKNTSENNAATAATAAALSGGNGEEQKCAQCLGRIDGTERVRVIGDREVWLHPECQPWWAEGDGWGVRR